MRTKFLDQNPFLLMVVSSSKLIYCYISLLKTSSSRLSAHLIQKLRVSYCDLSLSIIVHTFKEFSMADEEIGQNYCKQHKDIFPKSVFKLYLKNHISPTSTSSSKLQRMTELAFNRKALSSCFKLHL